MLLSLRARAQFRSEFYRAIRNVNRREMSQKSYFLRCPHCGKLEPLAREELGFLSSSGTTDKAPLEQRPAVARMFEHLEKDHGDKQYLTGRSECKCEVVEEEVQ